MTIEIETSERQVEPYSFSKDKLPRALSYPLKRSLLDNALRSAFVYEAVWFVRYLGKQHGNTVLDVHFSPEQSGNYAAGRAMITVWAVPAKERHSTEKLLIDLGLPSLCQWLAKSRFESMVWRGFDHSVTFDRADETLLCKEQ